MAHYVNVDELLQKLPDDLPYKASVKRVLMQAPTADVAPKSEVERLEKEVDRLSQVVLYHNSITEMEVYEAQTKVAREIFWDVDNAFCKMLSVIQDGIIKAIMEQDEASLQAHRNTLPIVSAARVCIAELKKKYTEEKT